MYFRKWPTWFADDFFNWAERLGGLKGIRSSDFWGRDVTVQSCDICRQHQILRCLPCWLAHAALLPAACFSRLPFLAAGSFCCWLPASHDGTQEWGPGVRKVKICVMASVEVRGPATQPGWQDHKSRKGPIERRRSLPEAYPVQSPNW